MKALGESSGRPQAVKKTSWTVDFHSDFASEVRRLPESVREKLKAAAIILAEGGPDLGRPYADTLKGSRHGNMKELRFDADGAVLRTPLTLLVTASCLRLATSQEMQWNASTVL